MEGKCKEFERNRIEGEKMKIEKKNKTYEKITEKAEMEVEGKNKKYEENQKKVDGRFLARTLPFICIHPLGGRHKAYAERRQKRERKREINKETKNDINTETERKIKQECKDRKKGRKMEKWK